MLGRCGFASCTISAAIGLLAAEGRAEAQAPSGFTRKILQKTEYPGDKYICALVEVEIEANAVVPRHTRPGVESGYFTSGSGTLSVKGQPDRIVKTGDGFQIPPETPHSVRNGAEKSRVAITYIVERDKPLASRAPE
jgi:quercetin dioxygenase-like cupin family protein